AYAWNTDEVTGIAAVPLCNLICRPCMLFISPHPGSALGYQRGVIGSCVCTSTPISTPRTSPSPP
ncbi:hypothetical protein CROQUDRAFT_666257, partial [Cronartium quercuum f. sp. fusiforme G11]